jgi:hypothetical protein
MRKQMYFQQIGGVSPHTWTHMSSMVRRSVHLLTKVFTQQTGIKRLVRSLAELGSENSDLDLAQLTAQRRKAQEETLADKLNIVKYEIDSKDSIKLFGSGRIENVGY